MKEELAKVKGMLSTSHRRNEIRESVIGASDKNKVEEMSINNVFDIRYQSDCDDSATCTFNFNNTEPEILQEIQNHLFLDYCSDNLPIQTKNLVFGVPIEQQISHQSTELLKSLTGLKKAGPAIRIFKNMLKFAGEKLNKYNKKDSHFLTKILQMNYKGSGELRDETYIQIMKQLHHTPSEEKRLRYFELMTVIAATFAPSTNALCYAVMNQLIKWGDNKNESREVRRNCRYIFIKVKQSFVNGMRCELPPLSEMMAIRQKKKSCVIIYFMNGNCVPIQTETHWTVKQLLKEVIQTLELEEGRLANYQLQEVMETNTSVHERWVENDLLVSDISAIQTQRMKSNKTQELMDFKLFFKIRVHYEYPLNDRDSCTLEYLQSVYEVLNSRIQVTYEEALILASIQMAYTYQGDMDPLLFGEEYALFLPLRIVSTHTSCQWLSLLTPLYNEISHYQRLECMIAYMTVLRQHHMFKSQYFLLEAATKIQDTPVLMMNQIDNEQKVLVVMNQSEMMICNPVTMEVLHWTEESTEEDDLPQDREIRVPLNSILSWGVSSFYFTVTVDHNTVFNKFYFQTKQGRAIDFVLSAYSHQLVGNDIPVDAPVL